MANWAERHDELALLAARQLFFVGGAPRSGTTWLQQILDSHPDISCRGEGLFQARLANPLQTLIAEWRAAVESKNTGLFGHTGGYPLPAPDDAAFLLRTAILLAMRRQVEGPPPRAVGEKTPENVFFFSTLRALFPGARFIAIARDPRDVLTSAWHFFQRPTGGEDAVAKTAFVRSAIPSLRDGARAMMAFGAAHPDATRLVTYEGLRENPAPIVADLFRFLGVDDAAEIVADCLEKTAFAAMTGGRPAGTGVDGAFLRKGIVGDWRSTLPPEANALLLAELGFLFPHFGWRP